MKKKILAAAAALFITLAFTACDYADIISQNEPQEFPVKFGHEAIEQAVDKVVVLNDSIADILIACGYTDKIVGRSEGCTQTDIEDITVVGADDEPDVGKITKAGAQVVFADESLLLGTYDKLKGSGIQVFRMAEATDEEALKGLYGTLSAVFDGDITGREIGKQKAQNLYDKLEQKKQDIPETQIVPTACYIFDIEGNTITGAMVSNKIFESAGAINIARDVEGSVLTFETLKTENPNYIFCAEGLKDTILKDDAYRSINAVKRSRVYEIPATEISRQGLTMLTAVDTMMELLYKAPAQTGPVVSVADEYEIVLFDGISYTLHEEDAYVLAIQKRLDDLHYLSIEPTGYFGESTASAVEQFQSANNISRRDGIADEETLKVMFSTAALESETPAR